jgi:poly-gamma-glutamate synthesis protein (capsule biosynthesis protein)
LIDAGADVILGNHVHAIHGVEVHKGKAILYSPGNFVAQQPREGASEIALAIYAEMSPDGYAAVLDIDGDRSYELRLVPTSTNADGLPEVGHDGVWQRIADRLRRLSEHLGTDLELRDGEIIVPTGATEAVRT